MQGFFLNVPRGGGFGVEPGGSRLTCFMPELAAGQMHVLGGRSVPNSALASKSSIVKHNSLMSDPST